jgi:hypothetical protein
MRKLTAGTPERKGKALGKAKTSTKVNMGFASLASKDTSIKSAGRLLIKIERIAERPDLKDKLPMNNFSLVSWLNSHVTQICVYCVYIILFVNMITLIAPPPMYRSTNYLMRNFVTNSFDGDHNQLMDIRRKQDFWEWGHNVLIPGIFSDSIGGQEWPDGQGYMAHRGATAYTIDELKDEMSEIGSFAGVQFKQTRVKRVAGDEYHGHWRVPHWPSYLLWPAHPKEETSPFGVDSGADRSDGQRFVYLSQQELGSTTDKSASLMSTAVYPEGGYAAFMLPFFSAQYIQPLSNMPLSQANLTTLEGSEETAAELAAAAKASGMYYCLRTSLNGVNVSIVCDPTPYNSSMQTSEQLPLSNAVKKEAANFISTLQRKHWIDHQSRFTTVTMQFVSRNARTATQVKLMFEWGSSRGCNPSFQLNTISTDAENAAKVKMHLWMCFVFVLYYCATECVEMWVHQWQYFRSSTNIIDLLNICFYFISVIYLYRGYIDPAPPPVSSIATRIGYACHKHRFADMEWARKVLALNGCLLVLKSIKYFQAVVRPMSILGQTLCNASLDLAVFLATFVLSMLAFANAFFVMMGPTMSEYYSPAKALHSLVRALFGDFNIDKIDNNSQSNLNSIIFLVYLFVAVFMILSMFFAILGEAQAAVQEQVRNASEQESEQAIIKKHKQLRTLRAIQRAYKAEVSNCCALLVLNSLTEVRILWCRYKLNKQVDRLKGMRAAFCTDANASVAHNEVEVWVRDLGANDRMEKAHEMVERLAEADAKKTEKAKRRMEEGKELKKQHEGSELGGGVFRRSLKMVKGATNTLAGHLQGSASNFVEKAILSTPVAGADKIVGKMSPRAGVNKLKTRPGKVDFTRSCKQLAKAMKVVQGWKQQEARFKEQAEEQAEHWSREQADQQARGAREAEQQEGQQVSAAPSRGGPPLDASQVAVRERKVSIVSQVQTSLAMSVESEAPEWKVEDRIKVGKESSQKGKEGVVVDPDWKGQIKVLLDGVEGIKSYLPSELVNLTKQALPNFRPPMTGPSAQALSSVAQTEGRVANLKCSTNVVHVQSKKTFTDNADGPSGAASGGDGGSKDEGGDEERPAEEAQPEMRKKSSLRAGIWKVAKVGYAKVAKATALYNKSIVSQFFIYLCFLSSFQLLISTMRKDHEIYFNNEIQKTWISNTFDVDHNDFMAVRRKPDVWEWIRVSLLPGIFNNQPAACSSDHWSTDCTWTDLVANPESWPDGSGPFGGGVDATPLSIADALAQHNEMSFDGGIQLLQVTID